MKSKIFEMLISIGLLLLFFYDIRIVDATYPAPLGEQKLWNHTWIDKLRQDLFTNYDKFAKPSTNLTSLTLKLTVNHIDVDELKSMMTVIGWMNMQWTDEKLKWNVSDYGNVSVIHVPHHEIWQPDITLYNNAEGDDMQHFGTSHCLVYNSGSVLWVPPAKFQVFCDMDMRYWPFDKQTCQLVFGSWTYSGEQIELQCDEANGAVIQKVTENHEWAIENITTKRQSQYYECCEEPYYDVTYNITVQRRSPMYKAVVITPVTCIVLMTLSCFWLPPQCGEKVLLNGLNIVVISIFLMYFASQLPVMAYHTPLVVLFYSSSLYLVTISMVISVIVLCMSRSRHDRQLFWFIKAPLDGWFGKVLCLPQGNYPKSSNQQRGEELRDQQFEEHNTAEDHQIISMTPKKCAVQQDWFRFAVAVDRIFFIIYCIIFIVLAITYSV